MSIGARMQGKKILLKLLCKIISIFGQETEGESSAQVLVIINKRNAVTQEQNRIKLDLKMLHSVAQDSLLKT